MRRNPTTPMANRKNKWESEKLIDGYYEFKYLCKANYNDGKFIHAPT